MYVVITKRGESGCFIKKIEDSDDASSVFRALSMVEGDGVQVVLLNNPSAYQEYSPYFDIGSFEDLIIATGKLSKGSSVADYSRCNGLEALEFNG